MQRRRIVSSAIGSFAVLLLGCPAWACECAGHAEGAAGECPHHAAMHAQEGKAGECPHGKDAKGQDAPGGCACSDTCKGGEGVGCDGKGAKATKAPETGKAGEVAGAKAAAKPAPQGKPAATKPNASKKTAEAK